MITTKQKSHPELGGARPACFSIVQWANHVRLERRMVRAGQYVADRSGFCAECTPVYQHKMLREKKCRYPDVVFREDLDGSLRGVRPYGPEEV